ncbi:RecJ-like exonuclease [Methanomicrobium sp. W14]|uniref:DHHA1 domain-containing protein n=1 Tax=Methanomicrobium sp. W14 TaxID=2817839 RepID=UPI001AE9CA58|nr:DHH family phosphoesterase [Methanomicrobium sp. W14]MBP2132451.1 RecJ-like exonuclease [Methanomicrobium sp. W14]
MSFESDIKEAAEIIKDAESVTIISHIDADGITSEAIMRQAVSRCAISLKSVFVRQLEPLTMKNVPDDDSLKIFIDLGAGQQNLLDEKKIPEKDVLIIDHHVSQDTGTPYMQVNGLKYGYEKLSAAGTGYLVAKETDDYNTDLAKLAVIGNVGDMMARENRALTGPARDIVEDGVKYGNIEVIKDDLNCYGISTRPLHLCLSYSDDPYIPGITNNQYNARKLIECDAGISLKKVNGKWRVWEDLSPEEKRSIIGRLALRLHDAGEPTERLKAEHYIFPDEIQYTPLRNASEYATMLNACGRWVKPKTGSLVCCGDRGEAYREAGDMLRHHRSVIREMMEYILDTGVTELSNLQYLHVGDRFPDTIVGIGAGMALSKLNWRLPIMIMCYLPDDPELVKISMRTNERMIAAGIDLQAALIEASEKIGGAGGGHKIAAGAYISRSAEEGFAESVNRILKEQLSEARQDNC